MSSLDLLGSEAEEDLSEEEFQQLVRALLDEVDMLPWIWSGAPGN